MVWIIGELAFLFSLIGIDLYSKEVIKSFLLTQSGQYYPVWKDIIEFNYVENYGASFGIFSGNDWLLIGFTSIAIVVMIGVLFFIKKQPKLLRFGLLTVIGGGIGNLVDRIALGYVRDFIDYKFLDTWFGIDFAIGNIADIFALVGLAMILIYVLFQYKEGDVLNKKLFKKYAKV